MDGNGALYGVLQGNTREILHKVKKKITITITIIPNIPRVMRVCLLSIKG